MRIAAVLALSTLAGLAVSAPAAAQTGAEVSRTEVEDSFFNPCTEETVDRTYTRHIRERNAPGGDIVLMATWSDGKGVGRESGRRYTMTWRLQQVGQTDGPSEQGVFTYRVRTTVTAQGSASDYTSDTVLRLRRNAQGDVLVDETEATGIQCS